MKQRIINWLLRSVVRVSIPEDIIRQVGKIIYLGGKEVSVDELRSLQAEAKAIENMRIWSIMNESIKQLAYERGWKDSTTIEHLNTAKAQFSVLETQSSIISVIKNSKT
jgi:hypothetical protein